MVPETIYRDIVDKCADAVIVTDVNNRIVYANAAACRLSSSAPGGLEGSDINRILKKDGNIPGGTVHFIEGQNTLPVEIREITIVGEGKDPGLKAFLLGPAAGRDLTVKMNADRVDPLELPEGIQLQKMESLSRLAGALAHDFNNYFQAITGYASVMKWQIDHRHPFYKYLELIEAGIDKAVNLTDKLRVMGEGGPVHVRPVDLNRTMKNAVRMVSKTRMKVAPIEDKLSDESLVVACDSAVMEQVFLSLLLNVSDSANAESRLAVSSCRVVLDGHGNTPAIKALCPGQYALFKLVDSGNIITSDAMTRIFEPFFTNKDGGFGLGLSFAYGVVRNHGGLIHVESEPGAGTSFILYMPLMEPRTERSKSAKSGAVVERKILIVDDDQMILSCFSDLLDYYGYDSLTAKNGFEAMELFKSDRDSMGLVIMDIMLPQKNGWEVLKEIRDIDKNIPVFMMTGYESEKARIDAMTTEATKVLKKPFWVSEVINSIRSVMGR